MAHDTQSSINIPQLLAVAVVSFLAIRWFMSKPTTPGAASTSNPTANSRRPAIDLAKIEHVASAFPQLDRRFIAWDLHRNGGSVQATMDRVLGGRALETPPPSWQPDIPAPAPPAVTAVTTNAATGGAKRTGPSSTLITRYGLQSRIGGKGKEAMPSEEQMRQAVNKLGRADALQKRKEDMILMARRRMLERDEEA